MIGIYAIRLAGEGNLVKVDAGDGRSATTTQKRPEKSPISCPCFQKSLHDVLEVAEVLS